MKQCYCSDQHAGRFERHTLWHIYNNVFLPRQLPTEKDYDRFAGSLVGFVQEVVVKHAAWLPWSGQIQGLLTKWNSILADELSFPAIFERLSALDDGDHFAMFIPGQNAALTISVGGKMGGKPDEALVTSFRVLPDNGDIMSCEGTLVTEYPTHAVRVPTERVKNESFARQLAELSATVYMDMLPTARQSGRTEPETWDVPASTYVTEWLMGSLAGTNPPATDILRVKKVIRDEVVWGAGHGNPWRRSGEWMTLKPVLQWILMSGMGPVQGTAAYKFTMAVVMAVFVQRYGSQFPAEDRMFMIAKLSRRMGKIEAFVENNEIFLMATA